MEFQAEFDKYDEYLEKMKFDGMTLRQVIGGSTEYQLVSIGLKKAFAAQDEAFGTKLSEQQALHNEEMRASQERENQLKRQNENLQSVVAAREAVIEELHRKTNQDALEKANLEQSRNNAVAQLDEANQQIAQQKGHIEDLQTQISIGVRGAINVIDTEEEERQKKELVAQIRKDRTIYDVEWTDEIKRNRKRAKLASTGEEIDFPWTEESKFFVIQEAEVSQFRSEYPSNQEANADSSLGNEETTNVTPPEVIFPDIPSAQAPDVPALSAPMVEGLKDLEVPGQTVEERLSAIELHVFGYVKQAVA